MKQTTCRDMRRLMQAAGGLDSEAQRVWLEDMFLTLSQIERHTASALSAESRLTSVIELSRPGLTAAMLEGGDYPSGTGILLQRELLYCLLTCDFGGVVRIVDRFPELKPGLSGALSITKDEWAELRNLRPLSENPLAESERFISELLAVH